MSDDKAAIVIRPRLAGSAKFLGELESEIMEIIWADSPLTVKRVLYFIQKKRPYAYTTIMTVMNRLANKGLLIRSKKGQAFIYSPLQSREEFIRGTVEKILDGLREDFPEISPFSLQKTRKTLDSRRKGR